MAATIEGRTAGSMSSGRVDRKDEVALEARRLAGGRAHQCHVHLEPTRTGPSSVGKADPRARCVERTSCSTGSADCSRVRVSALAQARDRLNAPKHLRIASSNDLIGRPHSVTPRRMAPVDHDDSRAGIGDQRVRERHASRAVADHEVIRSEGVRVLNIRLTLPLPGTEKADINRRHFPGPAGPPSMPP